LGNHLLTSHTSCLSEPKKVVKTPEIVKLHNFRGALNSIHSSETHIERAFGQHKHVVNKKRSTLGAKVVEGMLRVFYNHPKRHEIRESEIQLSNATQERQKEKAALVLGMMKDQDVTEKSFEKWWEMFQHSKVVDKLRRKKELQVIEHGLPVTVRIESTTFNKVDATVKLEGKEELKVYGPKCVQWGKSIVL